MLDVLIVVGKVLSIFVLPVVALLAIAEAIDTGTSPDEDKQ